MADCLDGVAGAYAAMKQPARAARLFGAAESLRAAIGTSVWPANTADVARSVASVRDQLDEPAFATNWAAGRKLPLEQALAEALAVGRVDTVVAAPRQDELTRREHEVVVLVAQGRTNRQIGSALVITEGPHDYTSSTSE
jgi:DNA-binding NarL/FixJ family response regulator